MAVFEYGLSQARVFKKLIGFYLESDHSYFPWMVEYIKDVLSHQ